MFFCRIFYMVMNFHWTDPLLTTNKETSISEISSQNRLPSSSMSDSPSLANLQNKQNRDQQYHAVRCQSNRNSNSNDSGSFKAEGNGIVFSHSSVFKGQDVDVSFFNIFQNTSKTFVHTQHFNWTNKRTAKVHTAVMFTVVHIIRFEDHLYITMWSRMDINAKSPNTRKLDEKEIVYAILTQKVKVNRRRNSFKH